MFMLSKGSHHSQHDFQTIRHSRVLRMNIWETDTLCPCGGKQPKGWRWLC